MADAEAGQKTIDFCAGGGGKTLALAAAMRDGGPLFACDTDQSRLESSDLDCKGPALAILTGIT